MTTATSHFGGYANYEAPQQQGADRRYHMEYGSVNPAKARKSLGDFLKIGGKSKKESPTASVISGSGSHYYAPSVLFPQLQQRSQQQQQTQQQPQPTYSQEYYNKYGPSPSYAQPVYMTPSGNLNGLPAVNGGAGSYPNGYHPQDPRNAPPAKGSSGNTVRYTDWFGSVAVRRPNARPEIPSFVPAQAPAPQVFLQGGQETSRSSWPAEHQPQVAPQYVAIALPPGVCMCPTTSAGTTRAKRKKKCKICGHKTINIRHTLTASQPSFRPALSTGVYAAPAAQHPQNVAHGPPAAALSHRPASWGEWGTSPYAVPHVAPPQVPPPPPPALSDDDSSPPTPETVRSVKSSASTVTLTKELPEMITDSRYRVHHRPPQLTRNHLPVNRKSIVSANAAPSAYNLIKADDSHDTFSSDTDDLSDNAVHDPLSSDALSTSPDEAADPPERSAAFKRFQASRNRGRRVSIISIGEETNADTTNVIKISTASSPVEPVANGDVKSEKEISVSNNKSQGRETESNSNKLKNSSKVDIRTNASKVTRSDSTSNSSIYISRSDMPSISNVEQSREENSNGAKQLNSNHVNISIQQKNHDKEMKKRNLCRNTPSSSVRISGQKLVLMNHHATDTLSDDSDDERTSHDQLQTSQTSVGTAKDDRGGMNGYSQRLNISDFDNRERLDDGPKHFTESNSDSFDQSSDSSTLGDEFEERSAEEENGFNFTADQGGKSHLGNASGRMNRSISSTSDVIYEEDEELDKTIDDEPLDSNSQEINSGDHRRDTNLSSNGLENINSSSHATRQLPEGFQATLSELLQVKSILKRPNSLDTSSENDSDFFVPTSCPEPKVVTNAINKKKSVQFSGSDNITVVEALTEGRRRKLSSPKATKKEKDSSKEDGSGEGGRGEEFSLFDELNDVYCRTSSSQPSTMDEIGVDNGRRLLLNGHGDDTGLREENTNALHFNANSTKLRANKTTRDPKSRHSTSSIPVADMSVRSGYTGGEQDQPSTKLARPGSSENLQADRNFQNPYSLFTKDRYSSDFGNTRPSKSRDFVPNAINSKYDSNWKAMIENTTCQDRRPQQGSKAGRTSKLPSPLRSQTRGSSAYEMPSLRDPSSSPPLPSLHRGPEFEPAGMREDLPPTSPPLPNESSQARANNKRALRRLSRDKMAAAENKLASASQIGDTDRRTTKSNGSVVTNHQENGIGTKGLGSSSTLALHSNSDSRINFYGKTSDGQFTSKISTLAKSAVNLTSVKSDNKRDQLRKSLSPNVQKNNLLNRQHLSSGKVLNGNSTSENTHNGFNSQHSLSNGDVRGASEQSDVTSPGASASKGPPLRPTRKAPAVPSGRRPSVPPPPPPAPPSEPPPPPPTEPPPPPPPTEPPPPPPPPYGPPPPPPLPQSSISSQPLFSTSYRNAVEDYPDYSPSPPSSPPPPLPKSSPPPLEHHTPVLFPSPSGHDNNSPRSSNGSSTGSYPFSSFRGDIMTIPTIPITPSPTHMQLKGSNSNSNNSSPRSEVLYSDTKSLFPQAMPMFSTIDEETKTATIRGRVKPSRPALTLDLNSSTSSTTPTHSVSNRISNRQPNPSLSSFDPLRRPRSMSPDDPYEHIYEELGSIPSSPTQVSQRHAKLHRLSKSSHYASQPSLFMSPAANNNTNKVTSTQSVLPGPPGGRQEKLRHVQTLPPGIGKSIFDGATKLEILEILRNAKGRLSSAADEDEEETPLPALDYPPAESGDVSGGPVDPPEEGGREGDPFQALRLHTTRASNISSNSDSSESSGLLRTDKERPVSADIERTDSGVGSETSKASKVAPQHRPLTRVTTLLGGGGPGSCLLPTSAGVAGIKDPEVPLCEDCEAAVDTRVTTSGVVYAPLVCRRCSRRRQERREILSEIIETELKYGRDLRIIIDQFYRPIQIAGLLSNSQLDNIFLNVSQLLAESEHFSDQLQDAYDIALESGDEDLLTVNVAKFFVQADTMMDAFEFYCVRQGEASVLLQTLEKEKELMRIFLRVSQMENTLLRRMNLHSFLMVPVQRVTKYPLLLSRLHKATPPSQPSRRDCRAAKEELERRLHHMNSETKEASPSKLWRRISMSVSSSTPMKAVRSPNPLPASDDAAKLHRLVAESLSWREVSVVREGRLLLLPPDTNNWTRRGRANKMTPVYLLLVTQGQPQKNAEDSTYEERLLTPQDLGIEEAALVAFKYPARPTKQSMYKEPWVLSRCVVSWEGDSEAECFEVTDLISKDTYYFKDRDNSGTEDWFRMIQFHAVSVGGWKKRRPALHNIMISGMQQR